MHKYLSLFLTIILLGCATTPEEFTKTTSETSINETKPQTENVVKEENAGQILPIKANMTINGQLIEIEVAATPEQQQIGLMYRTSLADNRAMLFPFSPPQSVYFWMKNTLIPLDMVFLRNGVVQAIAPHVPPCTSDPCPTYGPGMEIDQVLELRAGRAQELNLKQGDTITINFL
jgi:uncharacterized protein